MIDFKEIENKLENETSKIYTILKAKNCFQETDFNERFLPQLTRNMIQFRNISTKIFIGQTKSIEYLDWYKNNLPQFHFDEEDFHLEIITLLCHHGLSSFELLKRFLLYTLNLSEVNKKSNITLTKTSMLGDVVKSIKKIIFIKQDIIDELFNNEFRNTLAHDSWYLENNLFKFKDTKGIDRSLSMNDVYSNVIKIWMVYTMFTKKYTQDYYPECIEMYNDKLGKILDDVMPLYPDNP